MGKVQYKLHKGHWTNSSGSLIKIEINFLPNRTRLKLTLTWQFRSSWATDFFRVTSSSISNVLDRDEGACFLKSCLWPSSDVTGRLQNRKSDAEEEVTLKKYVAHDGQNCQAGCQVMHKGRFILEHAVSWIYALSCVLCIMITVLSVV